MTASQVSSNLFCYRYDAQGRRLEREDYDSTGNLLRTTRYLYQGWNCVAEFEASSSAGLSPAPSAFTRTRTYTWGLDLSQSKQGAGGVGGLCAITDETGAEDISYHYASDGNGNVVGLYDDSFTAVAEYEYSPFGELIAQNGPYAEENPYRFSTKYQNEHLGGLYYYGYRYYDASTGRWPSRDPIGEEGGVNLYAFVGNDGVSRGDALGLFSIDLGELDTSLFEKNKHGEIHVKFDTNDGLGKNFDRGCECPNMQIRVKPGAVGGDGGLFGNKVWPWQQLSGFTAPKLAPQFDSEYEYELLGGSCEYYEVTLEQQPQYEDTKEFRDNLPSDDPRRFFPAPNTGLDRTVQNAGVGAGPSELNGMQFIPHVTDPRYSILSPTHYTDSRGVRKSIRIVATVYGRQDEDGRICCQQHFLIRR